METIETTVSIQVRPPQEMSDLIMDAKRALDIYYPGYEDAPPHTTLYLTRFNEEKYSELLESLKRVDAPPFEAQINTLEFKERPLRDDVFVSLRYADPQQFIDLHTKVIEIANPLRENLIRYKDAERYKSGQKTEEEWTRIQRYGSQLCMEEYHPHITVGLMRSSDRERSLSLRERLQQLVGTSFMVDKIVVKLQRRSLPDETKIFESEITEIPLH
jgi:2'-5' RNA ligase